MSKGFFSYIRVSTVRQGQTGTSLTEQREAIERYAQRWSLQITKEYEEKETAAKQGRPVFSQMLKALKQGKARGVIIHKIDRSARNLRDWAEIGDLIDAGFEVHFANENLDLDTRGGRLSADIQAVVAADYIRNLREEVKKGFYGRLKQGYYPMPAPIGYVDMGQAKPKEPHPVQGPLVAKAFELYLTGRWGLCSLAEKMYELGLRTKRGGKVAKNTLHRILRNPFYTGIIRVKVRNETFGGRHKAIIPTTLFTKVQEILSGKNVDQKQRHYFIFRRLLRCAHCQNRLIGELQKKRVYYRCQNKLCPQKTIREDRIDETLTALFGQLRFNDTEHDELCREIRRRYETVDERMIAAVKASQLRLEQARTRLSNLTDAYIDGMIEKEIYLEKKNSLIMEEKAVQEQLANAEQGSEKILERIEDFLELANKAYLSYKMANGTERRELVQAVISNFTVEGKSLIYKLHYPFRAIVERQKFTGGGAEREAARIIPALLSQLEDYFANHQPEEEIEEVRNNFRQRSTDDLLRSALKISNQKRLFDKAA